MNSREETRISRMGIIRRSLDKAKDPDIEKLIAMGMCEWGCARRTMMEYIKAIQTYGK